MNIQAKDISLSSSLVVFKLKQLIFDIKTTVDTKHTKHRLIQT